MDTVIFAPDLIEYAFVGVSHLDAKLWESIKWIMQRDLLSFALDSTGYW